VSFAVGSVLLGFGRLNGDEEPEPAPAAGEVPADTTGETKPDEAPAAETAPHGA